MAKKKPVVTEQRVLLPNVSWAQFEQLLLELGAERQTRLTYCRQTLELMTPVADHDRCQKLIESLILVLVDELQWAVEAIAPALLTRSDLGCATEPDAAYYLRSPRLDTLDRLPLRPSDESRRDRLDLSQVPPPDLVVDIALTQSSIDKLPIYATLGVPEVWHYVTTVGEEVLQGQLSIWVQADDRYQRHASSRLFPFLSDRRILEFINQSDAMSLATALRLLRAWIQDDSAGLGE